MATDNFWGKFRRWRRHRPFWGGLFLILSGIELYLSANLTLGGVEVHLGPQGFLSYLLPIMLLICGALIWATPAQRLFYAIIGMLAALYSFIGLNLGGFFIGMLLGILGGALVIAWGPPRPKPGAELEGLPPTGEPTDHPEDEPAEDVGDEIFGDRDIDRTQQIEVAGHDDRPHEQQQPVRPASQSFQAAPPASAVAKLGRNPRAMVLALVPVAATAAIFVIGSNLPASADETCPEGLPSRTTSAAATTATTTAAEKSAAAKKAKTTAPAAKKTTSASTKTSTTASAATSSAAAEAAADDGTGNPIIDGIGDFIDGVGNLLGINGDDESSTPSTSPTSSDPEPTKTTAPETTAPTADPTPTDETTTATADPSITTAAPTKAAAPDDSADASESVLPEASGSEIPCLGARQYGLTASADDIPVVSKTPGLMEVTSLTMYNSTYDGVVEMPVAGGGTMKALKFSMDKATNKPFKLTITEPTDPKTVISSDSLTTTGTVKFYTPEFKGNLFGLIPVTFTPDNPPPLTLPILWFTKAKIKLAYVRCDTLTGDPLKVAR
ncbi:DUF6114 domain-containing protein [Actinoplanes sp. NPDC026619]|uniref:DUF6114 domain-containing protein n=1 Tax=Actinoplanes sp. NPDC026619 TaxID=3155798 RepID=UPI0033FC3EC0